MLLLNPKAYAIVAAMFAQFPREGTTPALVIAAVFTLNNLVAFLVWTLLGQTLSRVFRAERSRRIIDLGFAAMLMAVAAWMAVPVFA